MIALRERRMWMEVEGKWGNSRDKLNEVNRARTLIN
jgi:hypothetical protein